MLAVCVPDRTFRNLRASKSVDWRYWTAQNSSMDYSWSSGMLSVSVVCCHCLIRWTFVGLFDSNTAPFSVLAAAGYVLRTYFKCQHDNSNKKKSSQPKCALSKQSFTSLKSTILDLQWEKKNIRCNKLSQLTLLEINALKNLHINN